MKMHQKSIFNKFSNPCLRANGLALLPLALRPGLFVLFGIPGIFLFQNSYTNNVSAASLTLTIPSTLSLDISDPSVNNGFKKSDAATVSAKTDASAGYTLSIKAKSSSDLTNGADKLISISSNLTEDQFKATGTVNTWGYLPSKFNSSDNSSFLPAPTTEPSILEETSKANSDAANNYIITLGSKINSSTPSGTYSNTFILTAVANKPKTMQEFDCDLGDEETTTITDARDGAEYPVAKLKDGKCWMTQNLRLGDSKLSNRTLIPNDTNITSNYTLPTSSTTGFSDNTAENVYVGGTYNSGYYTWNAATAGTGASISSGEASGSICPKGWRLPTDSEFTALRNAYSNNSGGSMLASPANFVLSGFYSSSSFSHGGSGGYWWSSTAGSSNYAYCLYVSSSSATRDCGNRSYGFPVRCVAQLDTSYSITYNGNSGSNIPSIQTGKTKDGHVKLSDKTPTREGYEFRGWCDKTTSDASCSGNIYQPGSYIPITEGSENNITLYAMWKVPAPAMQNWTGCSGLSQHQVTTLADNRDNNEYTVAKLNDGKCWMTQNLRLGDSKLSNRTLTSANTNITSNYTLPASSTSGFSDNAAENVYVGAPWNSYTSGYYTWNAATAGTGKSLSSDGQEATGSICPKGWKLPSKTEINNLESKNGGDNTSGAGAYLRAAPANFVFSGYYYSSSFYGGGSGGYWWSSTAYSGTYACYLYVGSSSAIWGGDGRRNGYSIRCIAAS